MKSHSLLLKKCKLNYESVVACIIQYGYICYVCHWYRITLADPKMMLDSRELDLANEPINLFVGYRTTNSKQQLSLINFIPPVYQLILETVEYFANPKDPGVNLFKDQLQKLLHEHARF